MIDYIDYLKIDGMPIAVIDDFFTREEEFFVWHLINQLNIQKDSSITGTATNNEGTELRNSSGSWMGELFPENTSRLPIRPYQALKDKLIPQNIFWRYLEQDMGNVLVSYYGDGDFYKPHYDLSTVTLLTWLSPRDPQAFQGGHLGLEYGRETVHFKHNRTVIIPSRMYHEVSEVKLQESDKGLGRYTISVFV